jgi:cell division protein FtsW (lipid II flippase)
MDSVEGEGEGAEEYWVVTVNRNIATNFDVIWILFIFCSMWVYDHSQIWLLCVLICVQSILIPCLYNTVGWAENWLWFVLPSLQI